jgi:hypothetical protein
MDPAKRGTPEDEEPPRHHEDDEGQVDENETVGKQSIHHAAR